MLDSNAYSQKVLERICTLLEKAKCGYTSIFVKLVKYRRVSIPWRGAAHPAALSQTW
jgi:hypothetical protein